jgi:hypothetical protein
MSNDLPKTIGERNEGLTDFWDKGYNFGLEMAIGQILGEARWQQELKMRHDPTADAVIGRLLLLANIVESLKKPEEPS